uniref:Uncharacterized protein n=1 Tax=Felis catus TaxID=9685 RepID=A0ABI7YVW2_FELCA
MLGIGDIVMPGLLLCFVLRYDNYKKQANGDSCGASGPANISGRMQKVSYFHCTLIGYFVDNHEGQVTVACEMTGAVLTGQPVPDPAVISEEHWKKSMVCSPLLWHLAFTEQPSLPFSIWCRLPYCHSSRWPI